MDFSSAELQYSLVHCLVFGLALWDLAGQESYAMLGLCPALHCYVRRLPAVELLNGYFWSQNVDFLEKIVLADL